MAYASASAPPDGGVWTTARIISRPYLVSQHWPEGSGSFRDHLIAELKKADSFQSGRLEAHPTVWAMPFSGHQSMTMVLRTSTTPPAGNTLQVSWALTARSGVSVAMTPALPDGVQIDVIFDSSSYQAPPLPPRSDLSIDVNQLAAQVGEQGWAYFAETIAAIVNPEFEVVVSQGILTDSYALPPNWLPVLASVRGATVADLNGTIPMTVNDQQPFPLFGRVDVGWT